MRKRAPLLPHEEDEVIGLYFGEDNMTIRQIAGCTDYSRSVIARLVKDYKEIAINQTPGYIKYNQRYYNETLKARNQEARREKKVMTGMINDKIAELYAQIDSLKDEIGHLKLLKELV